MVPHLVTALTGPINELEARVLESMPATERWFRLEWMEHTPPFYASVDVRNAGFKLAPVDTNLFPSAFNLLTPQMLPQAVQAAMAAIEKVCPEARNLVVVPDAPLCNLKLAHLATLARVFTQAGLNVRLGTFDPSVKAATTLTLPEGGEMTLEPMVRRKGRLVLQSGFDPCTILLNTDLAGGVPPVLRGLNEQYLLPPLHAGWTVRRRSRHFEAYEELAKRFAKLLGMDPWLIHPSTSLVTGLDMSAAQGLEQLQAEADAQLTKVRRKYKDYGIQDKPFVVLKSDVGTNVGVMTVRDPKEIAGLNERCRGCLSSGQQGEVFRDFLVQEGVPTFERVHDAVAEPVVYTMDRYVVGGYYRVHAQRGVDESLNVPGSSFVPLAFTEAQQLPKLGERPGASVPNRFYMYGVVARLALLAAAYELEATDPLAETLETA